MPISQINTNSLATSSVAPANLNSTAQYYGFKNRIINGAMAIDQRNAGAAVTPSNTAALTYIVDRFAHYSTIASKLTYQQVADAPSGFKNSTKITVASQYTPVATDQFQYYQPIEGYNVADLNFGSSAASTITVSFWVKASVAGTYNIFFYNAAASRWYATTYTATTSWAQQTVTFTGDTTGTWATDNTVGIWVGFDLGQGATNLGTTGSWSGTQTRGSSSSTKFVAQANGSTLNITGVQLEKGSTATSFDYRPYGTELALCQRYYWRWSCINNSYLYLSTAGRAYSTTQGTVAINHPVPMRTYPSMNNSNNFAAGNWDYAISAIAINNGGYAAFPYNITNLNITGTFPGSERIFAFGSGSSTTSTIWIDFSAEL